jgi:zinc protease
MLLGIGGGIPEGYAERLSRRLTLSPASAAPPPAAIPPAPELVGRRITLVRKPTTGVGIHIGFPLAVGRADEDFVPLLVAGTVLGDHRTFHGRLMDELRSVRGLNYGDYAYVEHFHDPPETTGPTPNVPRSRQYFSIWLRPVAPENAPFALRAALFELDRLIAAGVTDEEVDATCTYLLNRSRLWALDVSSRLGFELDGRFHGTPSLLDELERRLADLGAAEVNAAIDAHLQSADLEIVLVGGATEELLVTLDREPAPLPDYPAPVDEATQRTDRAIADLDLDAAAMRVVPVEELFSVPVPPGGGASSTHDEASSK